MPFQLAELGAALKAAGDGGLLRRELLAGIRKGATPLVPIVRDAARSSLPHTGGLNEYVAKSDIKVSVRLSGRTTGVRIVNSRKGVKKGGTSDFGTDRGQIRHPVFGHKGKWVSQKIDSEGWFSKTLDANSSRVTPDVLAAMVSVAGKLQGRP